MMAGPPSGTRRSEPWPSASKANHRDGARHHRGIQTPPRPEGAAHPTKTPGAWPGVDTALRRSLRATGTVIAPPLATFAPPDASPRAELADGRDRDKNMDPTRTKPETARRSRRKCCKHLRGCGACPARARPSACSHHRAARAASDRAGWRSVVWERSRRRRAASHRTNEPGGWERRPGVLGRSSAVNGTSSPSMSGSRRAVSTSPRGTARPACDENTIGVVAIQAARQSTAATARAIKEIAAALDGRRLGPPFFDRRDQRRNVPIPSTRLGRSSAVSSSPSSQWDFRIERVQSINAYGHKYGSVPAFAGRLARRGGSAREAGFKSTNRGGGGNSQTLALKLLDGRAATVWPSTVLTGLGRGRLHPLVESGEAQERGGAALVGEAPRMDAYEMLSEGRQCGVRSSCATRSTTTQCRRLRPAPPGRLGSCPRTLSPRTSDIERCSGCGGKGGDEPRRDGRPAAGTPT